MPAGAAARTAASIRTYVPIHTYVDTSDKLPIPRPTDLDENLCKIKHQINIGIRAFNNEAVKDLLKRRTRRSLLANSSWNQ